MNNFWENIARYPRFFISSMIGLLLILISPFQKLLRTTTGKIIFGFSFLGIISFLTLTLKSMLDI